MPENLPLPADIPWKLVGVSQGMMDASFCDDVMPPSWRPSVAVFAYEPSASDLPRRCGRRVSFLRVSVSATGIQPPLEDDAQFELQQDATGIVDVGSFNSTFADQYLACYGVLLNVSVFSSSDRAADDPPYIMDFEPKNRELVQVAVENGEILTSSASRVGTDKSFTRVSGNEVGLSHTGTYKSPESKYGQVEASHTVSGKWTNSSNETANVAVDASRERSERYSTQTTLSQLYNLLSSYHLGTNRATFLMLPRPHVRQPTRMRTFVHGVRQLEGIQDFIILVSRAEVDSGLRIEVRLDTGHFPEDVPIPAVPDPVYDRNVVTIPVEIRVQGSGAFEGRTQVDVVTRSVPVPVGWEIDPAAGEPGRGGVSRVQLQFSEGMHASDLKRLEYRVADGTLIIEYRIERGLNADDDTMNLTFEVPIRRLRETTGESSLGEGYFVGTRTHLCAGYSTDEDGCVVALAQEPRKRPLRIHAESRVALPRHLDAAPDEEFMAQAPAVANLAMRQFLTAASRIPSPDVPAGYAYTKAFAARLARHRFAPSSLAAHAHDVPLLRERFESLDGLTVSDFVQMDVASLARRLATEPQEIVRSRVELARGMTQPLRPLQDLLFDAGSHTLRPRSQRALDEVASVMNARWNAVLSMEGHTDSVGGAGDNAALSERRARAAMEYLKKRLHDAAGRIRVSWAGEDKPAASNDTGEGRQANRRVRLAWL